MKVYELKVKVYLQSDLSIDDSLVEITKFIDKCLCSNEKMAQYHHENKFKMYCYNNLYPLAINNMFTKDKNYTFILRTVDFEIAHFFNENLAKIRTDYLIGLVSDIKIIPKHLIQKVYNLTPCIMKTNEGYWKNTLGLDDYLNQLKKNSIKKYNQFYDEKIDEEFDFIEKIIFKNKVPIKLKMKNAQLLGDKIEIDIASNEIAQKLVYFLLGTGILENCSRGAGFLNYQWYKIGGD